MSIKMFFVSSCVNNVLQQGWNQRDPDFHLNELERGIRALRPICNVRPFRDLRAEDVFCADSCHRWTSTQQKLTAQIAEDDAVPGKQWSIQSAIGSHWAKLVSTTSLQHRRIPMA